jgi:putative membrane protein
MTVGGHSAHLHDAGPGAETWLPLAVLLVVAAGYAVLALARSREPQGWSPWRTASFLTGIALLGLAVVPALSPLAPGSFPAHMYQHLLIGMYGPLALVLGAPVTLLLRSLPPRRGRAVGRVLRSAPVGVVAHPVTALVLTLGGLAALYLTPLYVATTENPGLHHLVHLHFLLAGYLFAYAFAGPDPAPHRPSVPVRLWLLGVAVAGHAVLAQLLYANLFVQVPVPAADLRGGASLMYFGGDVAELLVALAMVTTWRSHRATARPPRRPVALPA